MNEGGAAVVPAVVEAARRAPDCTALVVGSTRLSYAALLRRAGGVTAALAARSVPPDAIVGYLGERGVDWAAAVLGTLGAGAAYMPVDLANPPARIASIVSAARPAAVLIGPGADAARIAAVPDGLRLPVSGLDEAPLRPRPVSHDQLSYVLFTSGSTGVPKGAMCHHGGLANHLTSKVELLGLDSHAVLAQTAAMSFDISVWQLLTAWVAAGRTVIADRDTLLDPSRLVALVRGEGVTVLQLVPSYLAVLLDHLDATGLDLPSLRWASSTGEVLGRPLLGRWFDRFPTVPLLNAYGLAEVHDDTNLAVLRADRAGDLRVVPAGLSLPNVRTWVVDEHWDPLPSGQVGEIAYAGVCVGRGYVNDPARTAARYVPDPAGGGGRMFLSGDHGVLDAAGSLEYRGRADSQVKVRGQRVDLAEVEHALRRVSGQQDVAAVVADGGTAQARIIGYCAGGPPDQPYTRQLAELLPPAMVPAQVVRLNALPRNNSGKVDRRALAARPPETRAPAAPATTLTPLAELWGSLLSRPGTAFRPDDDFFAAGGTSLSAIKLVLAVKRKIELPEVVAAPQLAPMAQLLASRGWPAGNGASAR